MWQILKRMLFGLVCFLAMCLGGGKAYLDYTLNDVLQNTLHQINKYSYLRYATAELSWLGTVSIQNVQGELPSGLKLNINEIRLPAIYVWLSLPAKLPQTFTCELNGLQLILPEIETQPSAQNLFKATGYENYYLSVKEFRQLGYTQWQGDIAFSGLSQGEELKTAIVAKSSIWGNISSVLEWNKVPSMNKWHTHSGQMQLVEGRISYQDMGFNMRVLGYLAQRQATPVDSLRTTLVQKVSQDIPQLGMTLDTSIVQTIKQFIQNPQSTLNLSLQPTPTISLNELLNAPLDKLPARLAVKMSHSQ